MSVFVLNPYVGLFCLNLALASLALGLVAVVVGRCMRRCTLPIRHGIFCVALALMIVSPPLIWGAVRSGLGIIPVPMRLTEGEAPPDVAMIRSVEPVENQSVLPTASSEEPSAAQARAVKTQRPSQREPVAENDLSKAPVVSLPESSTSNLQQLRFETVAILGSVLVWIWGVGACGYLLNLLGGLLLIRRLHCSLRPIKDPHIIRAMQRASGGSEQKKIAMVFESSLVSVPLTLGFWRSVIVMPRGLGESLHESELACVLAHEVAHVKRHDTMIAILQQCASIAFWWNPLLRIINGQIVLFRERICDDYVVQRLGTGHALAEGIIKVAEWSLTRGIPVPLTTTLLDDAGEMEQRINRLMQGERRLSVNLNLPSAVLIGLVGLLFSAIPLMPVVRAQVAQSETALNLVDESVPVEARPEKEWSVRLRVIDNAGEQINDARVGIQLDYQGETDWQTEEQNGIFTVTVPTRIPRYCNLFVRAEGYAPMRAYWGVNQDYAADPLPAEFAFQMTKAITVGGRVIDQDNRPIVNARVLLGASSKKTDPTQRALTGFYNEEYRTDQQGQWRCELAPETISSATINVTHPDYVSLPTNYDQTAQIEELRNLTHSWTLKKGFVLTGRVVDSDGVPVAGAKLALGELNSSSSEGPFAVTDVAGRYRFENVAPMYDIRDNQDPIRFTIMVMKRGYAPVFEAVPGYGGRPLNDSTAQERVASFILKRGMKLTLHVKDSEGLPLSEAWVIVNKWHDTTTLRVLQKSALPAKTNEDGNWVWENAPQGEQISYDIGKGGFADVRNQRITVYDSDAEQTVTLKRPQFIKGTVIDAKTRQPIPDFIVERAFEEVGGHPDGLYWASDPTRGKNGLYRKRVTMPPHNGRYTYRARAEGYKTAISPSTPYQEGETVLNFELEPRIPETIQ